jgi:hypothetical protein
MASFKSYASPGGFKPIQAPDVARMVEAKAQQQSNYLQQAAEYNISERKRIGNAIQVNNQLEFNNRQQIFDMETRNLDAIQNQVMGNYEATIANAQTAAKQEINTLNALATFSQTAFQTVSAIQQKIETGKKQAVNDTIYATGISSKEMLELAKLDKNFSDQTYFENDAIRSIVDRTGASIQQVRFLVQNSNAKYWNESTALAEQRGFEQAAYIQSNYDTPVNIGNGETATLASTEGRDPNKFNLVFNQLRRQYDQENPTQLSTTVLAAKTNPTVKALQNSLLQSSNAQYRQNAKNAAIEAIDTSIRETLKGGAQPVLATLNNLRGAQRSAYLSDVYRVIARGAESDKREYYQSIWQDLITSNINFNGKEMSFAELQGGTEAFRAVNDAFYQGRARVIREFNQEQTERLMDREMTARTLLDEMKNQGIDATDADIDAIEARLDEIAPGYDSAMLENYKRNNTSNARFRIQKTKELQDLADRGLLTEERLDMLGLPNSVTQPFRTLAKQTSADRKENDDFKPQVEAIKNLVRSPAQIRAKPDGTYGWTVPLMEQKLQNQFLSKYSELKIGGDPNAVANAFEFVRQEFGKQIAEEGAFSTSTDNLGGYSEFESLKSMSSAGQSAARRNWVESSISRLGSKALDSNGSIFTISELNQQQEDMMKPGYKMDSMAAYVGQLFGIDPLAVINRQRLAAGMEALQLPESTMSFSNTVNPVLKRMLDSYQTPQTSTRAMISTRTFNPTLVPKGYGSLVVQAAQNANINPIYVAAFAEAENGSWDTNILSMGGSAAGVGLMQLNQAYFGSEQQLQDPAYNLNTGAQELARLAGNYSNWKDIIYAWNMGETGFANWVAAGRPDTAQAGYAAGLYERFEKARAKYGDVEALRSKGTLRSGFINKTSNSDTGFGWQPVSMQDEQGRPVVMSRDAASAFSQMVQDSGGMVKGMDITSSKRSEAKNRAVGGVSGSRHLHGEAIDIHGQSKKWMIENGPRYGWHLVDYPGSHGGHFEYRGS